MGLQPPSRLADRNPRKGKALEGIRDTPQFKYWNAFKIVVKHQANAPIKNLLFSPLGQLVWSAGNSIFLASIVKSASSKRGTLEIQKKISRSQEEITAISLRADGRVLLAGDSKGRIQLYDLKSKNILRTLSNHLKAIRFLTFIGSTRALSASDDMSIILWDVLGEKPIFTFTGHSDYIKVLSASPDNPDILFSGSYDKTIRCWDMRTGELLSVLIHSHPVESITCHGAILYAAAGPEIYAWDFLAPSDCLYKISPHQKTITALQFDSKKKAILSVSIDHHLKVITMQEAPQVEHSFIYPSPALSLALNGESFAVGMADGSIWVREKPASPRQNLIKTKKSSSARMIVERASLPKSTVVDSLLRSFEHRKALDVVLTSPTPTTLSLLFEEFERRGVTHAVLEKRSFDYLRRLSSFILSYAPDSRFSLSLLKVLASLIDRLDTMVVEPTADSNSIINLLHQIRRRVQNEICLHHQLAQSAGTLQLIAFH